MYSILRATPHTIPTALIRQAVFYVLLFISLLAFQPVAFANALACEQQAGSSDEPNATGGVEFSDIQADAAINACEVAVAKDRSPAHLYRLARALYKAELFKRAMPLAKESSDLDYGPAHALLGYALLAGNSETKVDHSSALGLLERALAKGSSSAARNLGYMYIQGVGVDQSDAQAAKYYLAGSELGGKISQYWVGWLYLNKKELGKSSEEAITHYKRSAEQGYGPAILALGFVYEMGTGVEQDLKQASDYYNEALNMELSDARPHVQRLQKLFAYQSDLSKNDWQAAQESITVAVMDQAAVQVLSQMLPEPIVETLYLPFYDPQTSLVRVNYGLVADAPVASYFLHKAGELTHLNGNAGYIHQFNDKHPLYLHAPEIAEHYLWFFTFFIRGELNEQFLIVDSIQDSLMPKGLAAKELSAMHKNIVPHECKTDAESGYLCQVDVIYLDNLYRLSMALPMNGKVALQDEKTTVRGLSKRVYSPITIDELDEFMSSLSPDTPIGLIEIDVLSGLARNKAEAVEGEMASLQKEQTENQQQQQILLEKIKANEKAKDKVVKEQNAVELEILVVEALQIIAETGRNQEAFDKLTAAAAQNSLEAKHELSIFYLTGDVVERDRTLGLEMIHSNAEAGFVGAQAFLGNLYYEGAYVGKDRSESLRYYKLAADQGHIESQHKVGLQYGVGSGVEKNYTESFKWYQLAAAKGHVEAKYKTGVYYNFGNGIKRDRVHAQKLFKELADDGYAPAQREVAINYSFGDGGVAVDDKEAVKWYRKAAEQDDTVALFNLALFYELGRGVEVDAVKAHQYFSRSAELGDAHAQSAVAANYSSGLGGVAVNQSESAKWYQLAADQGHAESQYFLGKKYAQGLGVEKFEAHAHKLYLQAAEQGYMLAQRDAAINYSLGRDGVAKNQEESVKWYRLAAEQGDAKSQYFLGTKYDSGLGVREDKVQAHKLYLQAAEQGYMLAQRNAAINYSLGKDGVAKNQEESVKWYRLAAEQGDATSQYWLGTKYDYGRGVREDKVQAHKWYRQAADQGFDKAQYAVGLDFAAGAGGVALNEQTAIKWYRLAADQGYAAAQGQLGVSYVNGRGVAKDRNTGIQWLKKAAKQGHKQSIKNLNTLGVNY